MAALAVQTGKEKNISCWSLAAVQHVADIFRRYITVAILQSAAEFSLSGQLCPAACHAEDRQ